MEARKNITNQTLENLNFTNQDLDYMLKKGLIFKTEDGYSYRYINEIINHSFNCISARNYELGYKLQDLCYFLEPNYFRVNIIMFLGAIKRSKIESSLTYLRALLGSNNEFANQDYNLYLYILSYLIDLPEDLREKALKLKLKDIQILEEDRKEKYNEELQKIISQIFEHNFGYAYNMLQNLINKYNIQSEKMMLLSTLLLDATHHQTNVKRTLKEFIKNEDYESAFAFLESEGKKHRLPLMNFLLLRALRDILMIKYTGLFPTLEGAPVDTNQNLNLPTAIKKGDYRTAESLLRTSHRHDLLTIIINRIVTISDSILSSSNEDNELNTPKQNDYETFRFLLSKNISIKSISSILGYSKQDRNMALALLAKDFYHDGHLDAGDSILSYLTNCKDKEVLLFIKNILKERPTLNDHQGEETPISPNGMIGL